MSAELLRVFSGADPLVCRRPPGRPACSKFKEPTDCCKRAPRDQAQRVWGDRGVARRPGGLPHFLGKFLGWLVCACGLLAQPANAPTGVDAARSLLVKGARAQAVRVLNQTIQRNPRDAEARLLLGIALDEDGHPGEAVEQLTEAVRLRPDSADAHNALGEAFNNLNELATARLEFEKAVQLNPGMAQAHVNLGMLLAQTDELARAAEHLDRALAMLGSKPEAAVAHYLRAKVHTDLSEVEQASTDLKEAVRLRPNFAEAWSDLGQARKTLQDDAGALAAFQRAVTLSPLDPVALTRLGAEYLHQGRVSLAILNLQKAYRIQPNDQTTLNSLQSALRQNGQLEQARQIKAKLVEVLRARDTNTQNQLNAARVNNEGTALEKSGDLRGALEKYRAAVELDPRHVELRVNYAIALLRLGQWKPGLTQLRGAMRQKPHDAVLKAAWDDAIGQAPPGSWTAEDERALRP